MTPDQAGVTEEPDAEDGASQRAGGEEKGLFRFIRRKPADKKRSETEWVDTLNAAPEPESEPELESPFMGSEEPEPEPEPEPVPEPEPEPHYRLERQWRRRHQDEMDEIHTYIDRVIGTDRDPLVRHRRLSDLGVRRHPSSRREMASVDVEGLDEELMIAFTFPQEELRSARMVYETEGGYVIEVTRAVGGDEDNLERQHYTVSRVGSVAHALDSLRGREIDKQVRQHEGRKSRAASSPAPVEEPGRAESESAPDEGPAGWDQGESEHGDTQPVEEDEFEKAGLMGGFASRFRRDKREMSQQEETPASQEPGQAQPSDRTGEFPTLENTPTEGSQEPAGAHGEEPVDDSSSSDDEDSRGGLGGFASRFMPGGKKKQEPDEPGASGDLADEASGSAEDADQEADESQASSSKRGLLGGIPGFKRRRGAKGEDEDQDDGEDAVSGSEATRDDDPGEGKP